MPQCLLGLGSNLGDRESTLRTAVEEIDALPNVRVLRCSGSHRTQPIGTDNTQAEFLNAAALIDCSIPPLPLLEHLQRIESRHGRVRDERWGPRTLDIDLLLYGDEIIETPALIVPHMRMSFRRFVLEPAAEVAPKLMHPVVGWPVERLLLHLGAAKDELVIVSPSQLVRDELAFALGNQYATRTIDRPTFKTADNLWPPDYSTWLALPTTSNELVKSANEAGLAYAAAAFPKLTILLDAPGSGSTASKATWSAIVRQPGRGPLLRLQRFDTPTLHAEVFAAVESIWSDLGPPQANRLE